MMLSERFFLWRKNLSSVRVQRANLRPELDTISAFTPRMKTDARKSLSILSTDVQITYNIIFDTVKQKHEVDVVDKWKFSRLIFKLRQLALRWMQEVNFYDVLPLFGIFLRKTSALHVFRCSSMALDVRIISKCPSTRAKMIKGPRKTSSAKR